MHDFITTDPETAAIGCALSSEKALGAFCALTPRDMLTQRGREILAALQAIREAGRGVDMVSADQATGGRHTDYLVACLRNTSYSWYYQQIFEAMSEAARRERAGEAARGLLAALADRGRPLCDAVAAHVDALKGITDAAGKGRSVTFFEAAMAFLDGVRNPPQAVAEFGVEALDALMGGLLGGTLCVVGARPGTGKSALALCAALQTQRSGSVLFCSYEMRAEEIVGRSFAALAGLDAALVARRCVRDGDYKALAEQFDRVAGMNVHFCRDAVTPAQVRQEAKRLGRDGKLRLVVVDYLQLMSSGQRAENRRVEVGQISRALKSLALDLGVPVLALSQLNRQSEAAPGRVPSLGELRESGDIEQDADVVVLMYTPPAKEGAQPEPGAPVPLRFLIAKNRSGPSGQVVRATFDGRHMRFGGKGGA